jgi:hypothetical protein
MPEPQNPGSKGLYLRGSLYCSQCERESLNRHITSIEGRILCDSCMILMGANLHQDNHAQWWSVTQKFRFSFREAFGVELPLIDV